MSAESLISNLYAAANGRRDWASALQAIADALNLWTVQLLGVNKKNGHLMFSTHGGRASPQTALDYFRSYNAVDPRIAPTLAKPPGEWMHCHELFDETYVAGSSFYQDFLIPHGGRYVSATRLIDNDEVGFIFALMRGHGSQPLGQHEFAQLERFRHHMKEALENLLHLRETYAELGMARELLGQFRYPMLLVNETRGIWHRNPAAGDLLARGDVISAQKEFLICQDKASDHALTEAIYALQLSSAPEGPHSGKKAIPLKTADGRPYLAFVSAVRPAQTMGAFGHTALALVVLHDPASSRESIDPFILAECFDLTPAEARVAVQIAAGASAKEIAQNQSVALPTVRTHIQRIMQKAGVDRQADLIRVLMALPIRA